MFNAGYGIGDFHKGQAAATLKSKVSDAGYGIGDGHGGHATATFECIVSDADYGIGNNHRSKAGATREIASYCVSADFDYNGRKVLLWMLKK